MFLERSSLVSNLYSDLAPYYGNLNCELSAIEYGPPALVRSRAAEHMMDSFLKKYIVHGARADERAKALFLANNEACARYQPITIGVHSSCGLSEPDVLLYGQFCHELYHIMTDFVGDDAQVTWSNVADNARVGPGSAINARGTSFYAKMFASRLTSTSESLYNAYSADVTRFPTWIDAEISRILSCGTVDIVHGSRSTFVPKNVDVSRQISVEPSLNMYYQLGMGRLLEKRLARVCGIDLATQPDKNRMMARSGSIDYAAGESFATIDLSSASDRISLAMIGACMPAEELDMLLSLRSSATEIDGEWHQLYMMSTMGNGFTFPLQTIVFAAVVRAVYRIQGIPLSTDWSSYTYGVFGDDIVIQRRAFTMTTRLLALLGLEVNSSKSFETGAFKESCGHDYYHGYNIRPAFLRRNETVQDAYVLFNLLCEWTSRTGIALPNTCRFIVESVPKRLRFGVPLGDDMSSGFRVPYRIACARSNGNGSAVYRSFRSRPKSYRLIDELVCSPRGEKSLSTNPAGLMLSLLKGEWRHGKLSTRSGSKSVPWDLGRRVTPNWDYVETPVSNYVHPGVTATNAQLVAAAVRNLSFLEAGFLPRASS
jgi:hypothetical protein